MSALLVALTSSAAMARGTVRIDQGDGSVQTYRNSVIHVVGEMVRVFSPDNHDTLIISHGACSDFDAVEHCLPYRIMLYRNGTDHAIGFDHGSVYLNRSDGTQALPRSSMQLPPRGVLVFVRTARGTSIAVHGTIDRVTR